MAYSIYKKINVKFDPNYNDGKLVATFVLDNGSEKRLCVQGGLPNDKNLAEAFILNYAELIFSSGRIYQEGIINLDSPASDFLDNLPTLQIALNAVNNIANLSDAKGVLLKMVKAIYALKEMEDK